METSVRFIMPKVSLKPEKWSKLAIPGLNLPILGDQANA